MTIKSFTFNPFQENTYLVYTESGDALIIDPGCSSQAEESALSSFIEDNKLSVKKVLNTHLHIDHIIGNRFLEERYGVHGTGHQADEFWLKRIKDQSDMFGLPLRHEAPSMSAFIKEGDTIELGQEIFEVIEMPGHSPGSVAFYNKLQGCVFSGDSIFAGSIGRTDFKGGDYDTLINSLRNKLMMLPENTVIFCGHGPSTSVARERQQNPYI